MKSIIRSICRNYSISFIVVILAYTAAAHSSPPCGLYGAPPCQFLPAPPGQTPSCARPGKTYCEHIDNYPTYLIKHLVHKWGYEAKNLIVDETWDDFAAVAWHDTPVFYDPAFIFPGRHSHYGSSGGSGGGDGGAANGGKDFGGYNYRTPSPPPSVGDGSKYAEDTYVITKESPSTEPPTFLLYSSAGQRLHKNQLHPFNGNGKVTPHNPTLWLKRIVRDLSRKTTTPMETETEPETSSRSSRDVSINMDLMGIVGVSSNDYGAADNEDEGTTQTQPQRRYKRQSPGRTSLCQTTSQFITPQAALNSKGNWMFVVNESNTVRQAVKAELCASNTCSNICQLPNNYNSRCEQKFVQKRLIALQANGQNLYTDTFWFPSCCVCTISQN